MVNCMKTGGRWPVAGFLFGINNICHWAGCLSESSRIWILKRLLVCFFTTVQILNCSFYVVCTLCEIRKKWKWKTKAIRKVCFICSVCWRALISFNYSFPPMRVSCFLPLCLSLSFLLLCVQWQIVDAHYRALVVRKPMKTFTALFFAATFVGSFCVLISLTRSSAFRRNVCLCPFIREFNLNGKESVYRNVTFLFYFCYE